MINKILASLTGQFFFVLLGLAIVSAFSVHTAAQEPEKNILADTHWTLKEISGVETDTLSQGNLPKLSFTQDRINGFNGCNRLFGNYATGKDGSIDFGQLGTTRMACADLAGELEKRFNEVLDETRLYAISRGELNLMDGKRQVLMVFLPHKR